MAATYFIFDMDQTLADPLPAFYFIDSLRRKYSTTDAYNSFVSEILKEETSAKPLGLLRPGILPVMSKLSELQKANKIKSVIIYSNNGHLETLEFIRDLIQLHTGNTNLISECIHWHHPMRDEERVVKPGVPNKTWTILKNIMQQGNCKAPETLAPHDVYFFDDIDHIDLQHNLGSNYYKVPAYDFKASVNRIAEIYRKAAKDIIPNPNINSIIQLSKNQIKNIVSTNSLPPKPDEGINMMMNAIKRVEEPIKGGYKRSDYKQSDYKRRRKTIKKKSKRYCCYSRSKNHKLQSKKN
jgi:hypothetical protein